MKFIKTRTVASAVASSFLLINLMVKEINIKIRFDDEHGRIGFAIDRSKETFDNVFETLRLIGALEMLKDREKARIDKTKSFKTDYTPNKDDDFKFWVGSDGK